MNNVIGLLNLEQSFEQEVVLEEILKVEDCSFLNLNSKNDMSKMDGLIITGINVDHINVSNWLLSNQHQIPLFVWIICKGCNDSIKEFYSYVIPNSVFEMIDIDTEKEQFLYQIKNAIKIKNEILNQHIEKTLLKEYDLDGNRMCLNINQKEVYLTKNEFKIVALLEGKFGEVVSYEEIISTIWPKSSSDLEQYKFRVTNMISHIRNKLKDQDTIEIAITRTVGYRLKFV